MQEIYSLEGRGLVELIKDNFIMHHQYCMGYIFILSRVGNTAKFLKTLHICFMEPLFDYCNFSLLYKLKIWGASICSINKNYI